METYERHKSQIKELNVLTKKALWALNTCIRTCLLHDLESGRMKMWVTMQVGPRLLRKLVKSSRTIAWLHELHEVNFMKWNSCLVAVSTARCLLLSVAAIYCSAALSILSKGNQKSATCLCSALSWTNKPRTLF